MPTLGKLLGGKHNGFAFGVGKPNDEDQDYHAKEIKWSKSKTAFAKATHVAILVGPEGGPFGVHILPIKGRWKGWTSNKWELNGTVEAPSLNPSIKSSFKSHPTQCIHGYFTDGVWNPCSDHVW